VFVNKAKYVEMELSIEQIFRKYYPRLCDFAFHFLHEEDEVCDVVQDAFMSYWENKENIPQELQAIKGYLYTGVKYGCLNKLRHQKIITLHHEKYQPLQIEEAEVLDNIIHAEIIGKIHHALNSLPEGCAMIFKMGYLEGLKNPEIAEKLNISIHTVKSQKKRAATLLKQQLDPQTFFALLSFFLLNR